MRTKIRLRPHFPNLYMTKILFSILFCAAAFMANGCVSVQMKPSAGMGPDVYRISALATSRKIIGETVTIAKERCAQTNKQYLFVKNIFQHSSNLGIDMVSYELYFTCVEAGDPRLNELKSLLSPAEKKDDQAGQTSPAKEPVQEKPSVSSGKDAAPAPDKLSPPKDENQGQQEKPVKVTEEQVREKNPRIAVPESMQTDDSPIIEEDLGGHPLDRENYLKRRFRKKKQTK